MKLDRIKNIHNLAKFGEEIKGRAKEDQKVQIAFGRHFPPAADPYTMTSIKRSP